MWSFRMKSKISYLFCAYNMMQFFMLIKVILNLVEVVGNKSLHMISTIQISIARHFAVMNLFRTTNRMAFVSSTTISFGTLLVTWEVGWNSIATVFLKQRFLAVTANLKSIFFFKKASWKKAFILSYFVKLQATQVSQSHRCCLSTRWTCSNVAWLLTSMPSLGRSTKQSFAANIVTAW